MVQVSALVSVSSAASTLPVPAESVAGTSAAPVRSAVKFTVSANAGAALKAKTRKVAATAVRRKTFMGEPRSLMAVVRKITATADASTWKQVRGSDPTI